MRAVMVCSTKPKILKNLLSAYCCKICLLFLVLKNTLATKIMFSQVLQGTIMVQQPNGYREFWGLVKESLPALPGGNE